MAITRKIFEDEVFFNTVLIENLTNNEFGTGFLIKKKIDEKFNKQLLFSNKHVFWGKEDWKSKGNLKKRIQLTLHVEDEKEGYKLGNTRKFIFELTKLTGYIGHSDPDVDVACVNISSFFNESRIANRSISMDDFDLIEEVSVGQKVIFVGYPKYFFDKTNFLPVARFGTIASIPSIDFEGKRQILIDAPVFPGSSGSPVFVQPNGKKEYRLLGIISENIIGNLDFIKVADSNNNKNLLPIQVLNFGMLFKLDVIKEILCLA